MSGILAMLESNMEHFGAGYGFWPNLFNRNLPKTAGTEWRALVKFLECLDSIDVPDTNVPLATPSISPSSFMQSSAEPFTFRLTWPVSVSQSTMDAAFENRMVITKWSRDGQDNWVRSYLVYPDDFDSPNYQSSYVEITTEADLYPPPAGKEIKYEIRTWDDKENWKRDTSLQRTPED